MTEQKVSFPPADFSHTVLPVVNKTVLRMGLAGNYGLDFTDISWSADRGANYWVWGRGFGKVTDGIREFIKSDHENHVVAMLGWGYFGWQVKRSEVSACEHGRD
jgi:hypothetical protein